MCVQWFYLVYFTAKFLHIPNSKMAYIFPILFIYFPISQKEFKRQRLFPKVGNKITGQNSIHPDQIAQDCRTDLGLHYLQSPVYLNS